MPRVNDSKELEPSKLQKGGVPDVSRPWPELKDERQSNLKTFEREPKNTYTTVQCISPVHYDDGSSWQDIDLRPRDFRPRSQDGDLVIPHAPYTLKTKGPAIEVTDRQTGGVASVTLDSIGGNSLRTVPDPEWKNSAVQWTDIAQGLDIGLIFYPQRILWYERVKSKNAPQQFQWTIESPEDGPPFFQSNPDGADASTDPIGREKQPDLNIQTKNRSASRGRKRQSFRKTWSGKVAAVVDPETRRKGYVDPAYPVQIKGGPTTTTQQVSNASWDGYATEFGDWVSDEMYWGRLVTVIGYNQTYTFTAYAGVYFPSVPVPQSATITSATCTLYTQNALGATRVGTMTYGLDNTTDANSFTNNSAPNYDVSLINSNQLSNWGTTHDYLSMTTGLQQIVNKAGWTSMNAVRWAGTNYTYQDDQKEWVDYAENASKAPTLEITYTPPISAPILDTLAAQNL